MRNCDVIIVGGGPAGLMAAISAGRSGAKVILLEKGNKLARKLLVSGGGRCNVTNRKPEAELIKHIPGNGRFMHSALAEFGPEEIIRFFEELGVALKEEDSNRMFPRTDRAITVADALTSHMRHLGVQMCLNSPVDRLLFAGDRCSGVRLQTGDEIAAGAVVIAVGGRSVPQTGSTGDGYAWAQEAGHTITDLYPTEVPITAGDPWIADRVLQGLSLKGVELTLYDARGKRLTVQRGDMIFTHFGLSGPAALRASHYLSVTRLRQGPAPLRLTIDLFPDRHADDLHGEVVRLAAAEPRKMVRNVLRPLLPERLIPLVLQLSGIDEALTGAHLSKEASTAAVRLIKALPITATGTLSLDEAFVTGGGVSVREVDPRSMGSRRMPGLYFAGEVLDVHGHTGGYNITVAFATGYLAGKSAAGFAQGLGLHSGEGQDIK